MCLLQEVYAEIPLKEPAGFRRVHQQDICRAEDYRESPDAHVQRGQNGGIHVFGTAHSLHLVRVRL